ncbi:hypothetical protein [Streptomyces sp. NBC_00847]|uniref:hypothetical protein n=1 Tax=Streptomyces sp. NBC_00847 TaxID=2975850 RepID=UPI00224ED7BB|nr:hypothetical protein [Streptomyces sp. NBC_00847]MCX4882256.1 hypothetical protein [Streptomyces sp. NBC_00847]
MIDRRGFGKVLGVGTGATALSVAGLQGASAAQTVPTADAAAVPAAVPATASGGRTGSPRLKQIRAGPLDGGYAELGPAHGPAAICLHGWPYDIHSYVDVGG